MIIILAAIGITITCFLFYRIKVHIHSYSKPIVSRYISFNTRDIVYECRCGKREIIRDRRPFDEPFPIPTTNITHKELETIANENKNIIIK